MHTCKDTQWSIDTFIENCIPIPRNCFEQTGFALVQLLFLFHKGYFYYCNISLICNREEEYCKAHCSEQTNNRHICFQLLCLSAGATMWGDLEERGVMCPMQMIKLSCPQHTHTQGRELDNYRASKQDKLYFKCTWLMLKYHFHDSIPYKRDWIFYSSLLVIPFGGTIASYF